MCRYKAITLVKGYTVIQGSKMMGSYRGMRRGISLVEMLVAVVLFGVLAVLSFKYVKTYYNTNIATKQARVAALIDQGTQLSNAYDVYSMRFGAAPSSLAVLSDANVSILTKTPATITAMGTVGWQYTQTALLTSGGLGAVTGGTTTAYYFDLTGTTADYAAYCAVTNNMINPSVDLNTTAFPSTTFNMTSYPNLYCVADTLGVLRIFFVK